MRKLLLVLTGFLVGSALVVATALATPQGATPAAKKLTIQHVTRGCHVFSNGKTTGASMRIQLVVGQRLTVLNQDVDVHKFVQFAGPTKVRLGGAIMMSHSVTLSFPRKGTYRLGTKVVEMEGMEVDVKTIGPDNNLRLVVTVA